VTKVPVHELDKKANKLAFTIIAHKHIIYRYIHNTSKLNQSINQSITKYYKKVSYRNQIAHQQLRHKMPGLGTRSTLLKMFLS